MSMQSRKNLQFYFGLYFAIIFLFCIPLIIYPNGDYIVYLRYLEREIVREVVVSVGIFVRQSQGEIPN